MILDTCALLWLAEGGGELSPAALQQIKSAPAVYVSAITGFEIALKYRQHKLKLPLDPATWYLQALAHHRLSECPVTATIAIQAAMLPLLHRDPCDRFIIATALENHWPIITKDSLFTPYGVTVIG